MSMPSAWKLSLISERKKKFTVIKESNYIKLLCNINDFRAMCQSASIDDWTLLNGTYNQRLRFQRLRLHNPVTNGSRFFIPIASITDSGTNARLTTRIQNYKDLYGACYLLVSEAATDDIDLILTA